MDTEQIFQLITDSAREIIIGLEDYTFKTTDSLELLGANSVDRAEIVMMVMEAINLKIPRTETVGPRNIGELAELIYAKLSAK